MKKKTRRFVALVAVLALTLVSATSASATHAWGGYHWARQANPFTIQLGDNLSSGWAPYLSTASSDWSTSSVLDTAVVPGAAKGNCRPTAGRVEVCNKSYGFNGWLGLAQIWITGGVHITQGAVKMNDSYFSLAQYNNTSERQHVMCQEVGHTFGLDHQSTDRSSLNTCMDYYFNTSDTDTKSIHPNAHDYEELGIIYAHLDSTTTIALKVAAGAGAGAGNGADGNGTPPGASPERGSWYVQDLGGGRSLVTHIFWGPRGH